jgi:hypothetical protein
MSKFTKQILQTVIAAALLLFFSASMQAQDQTPPREAGRISESLRTAAYPEAIYGGGLAPDWDR